MALSTASDNVVIAKDLYDTLVGNREVSMTLRSQEETKISIFIRHNKLQKFFFEEIKINALLEEEMLEEDDDDYCEMPQEVYERACVLVTKQIEGLRVNLEHKTIEIAWVYDKKTDELQSVDCLIKKEIHFSSKHG